MLTGTGTQLGLEIIRPTISLDGGINLGAYNEGVCAEGKDFLCSEVGGVHSCRPCNFPQLEAFRALQGELNRIVQARGYKSSYMLDIDGRMGPLTARTLAAVGTGVAGVVAASTEVDQVIKAAAAAPNAENTHRLIASYVPELRLYFNAVANKSGAPQSFPEAPPTPGGGTVGPIPQPGTSPVPTTVPPPGKVLKAGPSPVLFLALVAVTGGIATGVWGWQRYKQRRG